MPNTRTLDVVVDTQLDYVLPSRKTHVPRAQRLLVPGLEWLCTRTPENSFGVLFTENKFTPDEYKESDLSPELPPHCLIGSLGDYDPVGVQNAFNQRLLSSRGVPVYHLHKKMRNMWDIDADDNQATVHSFQGSTANAYFLSEFITKNVAEAGVKRVNIWGVSSDDAVLHAITGFLLRKFKVNVVSNLCASVSTDIEDLCMDMFTPQIAEGQLTLELFSW
jgi:nicotinamidase-related amidase